MSTKSFPFTIRWEKF